MYYTIIIFCLLENGMKAECASNTFTREIVFILAHALDLIPLISCLWLLTTDFAALCVCNLAGYQISRTIKRKWF